MSLMFPEIIIYTNKLRENVQQPSIMNTRHRMKTNKIKKPQQKINIQRKPKWQSLMDNPIDKGNNGDKAQNEDKQNKKLNKK